MTMSLRSERKQDESDKLIKVQILYYNDNNYQYLLLQQFCYSKSSALGSASYTPV
jgi:hypothetical protein